MFIFRRWADFDFLIVCLTRLRRAAKLAEGIPEIRSELTVALQEFDKALPHLKRMRDVSEHIDDYAIDRGRESSISRKQLEVSTVSNDDSSSTIEWLGVQLNSLEALNASQRLFESIKGASRAFTPSA